MDLNSLFLIQGIILLLFGVTMLVDSIGQPGQESNYWFAGSNFCGAIGLLLRPFFSPASTVATLLVPNAMLFGEWILLYQAVAVFVRGGRRLWGPFMSASMAAVMLQTYAIYRQPNRLVVAYSISAITIVIPACAAWLLIRCSRVRIRVPMLSMATLLGLYSLNNLLRLFHDWTDPRLRFYHILFDRTVIAGLSVSYLLMSEADLRHSLVDSAILDPLTGAFNRRGLHQQGQTLLAQARRRGQPVAALMIDIDHFKGINDTYGHEAGDAALHALGAVLQPLIGDSSLLVRLGGDEFLVLLPACNEEQAAALAEDVRQRSAQETIESRNGGFHLHVSVGVAALRGAQIDIDSLMRLSDQNLYQVKASRT